MLKSFIHSFITFYFLGIERLLGRREFYPKISLSRKILNIFREISPNKIFVGNFPILWSCQPLFIITSYDKMIAILFTTCWSGALRTSWQAAAHWWFLQGSCRPQVRPQGYGLARWHGTFVTSCLPRQDMDTGSWQSPHGRATSSSCAAICRQRGWCTHQWGTMR